MTPEQQAALSVCVYHAWGSLTPEERTALRPMVDAWARAAGGQPGGQTMTTRAAGPIPDRLLRRLGRRNPLDDLRRCDECHRLVLELTTTKES